MFYKTSHLIKIFLNGVFKFIGAAPNSFSSSQFAPHHLMVMQHSNQCGVMHAQGIHVVISFDDETRTFGDQVLLLQLHLIN